jgi:hypothetical protein
MNSLALSTLLFHSLGTVAIVLGSALNSCLPVHRSARRWELVDNDVAVRSDRLPDMALPRAA